MAASATKDRPVKGKDKEREAKRKAKEKEAKRKDEEREAKRKAKEKEAKRKDKEKEAKRKDKEREAKRKAKEKEAKRKDKEKAAKRKAKPVEPVEPAEPVEPVAVPERGDSTAVPAEATATDDATSTDDATDTATDLPPELAAVPDNDGTLRPKGHVAEVLGKEDAVTRSTKRVTLAASYTTRDHDIVRAWALSRGGRPADVRQTGNRGAGVLRIEFPDGPGDDSSLEAIDWDAFFATFDDSDVDFLYQERVRTGAISRFHKFVRADA